MPITNVFDNRTRPHRFLKINAVAEPTWHDNSVADADQAHVPGHLPAQDSWAYAEKEHVTVAEAVQWANSLPGETTLYLYDGGDGIYETLAETGGLNEPDEGSNTGSPPGTDA